MMSYATYTTRTGNLGRVSYFIFRLSLLIGVLWSLITQLGLCLWRLPVLLRYLDGLIHRIVDIRVDFRF